MSGRFQDLIAESKRRAHRTEELFARSHSIWKELDEMIRSTSHTIDDWTEIAKKKEGAKGLFFSAHLEVIKMHLQFIKKRRPMERPLLIHFNKIPPSRLIKKV